MSLPVKELYDFDSFRLDPAEQMLLRDGKPVPLEPKVMETLLVLIRSGGRLVGKEELMQAVWPDSFVEESNLTRNISILRKALNRTDNGPQYIETVPKRGYRFVGELHRSTDEPEELFVQSSKLSVVVEEEESDETRTAHQQGIVIEWKLRHANRLKRAGILATVLLISGVVLAVYFRFFSGSGQEPTEIDSLAVLPLVNVGANPDTEYLSDGITDSLLNSLSELPRLKVMSRNSVMRYKGLETDAQQAGKQLGVRAVLTGRVMPRGDGLSISIELVDARDNSHLWGEQYDRRLSDLPAMQAELARDISGKLRRRDQQRVTKRYTANAEAYDLYLRDATI
jgi:TolB-like protein/DNA-binding winged helix-turn-helix (wHTH) protein